VVIPLTDTNPSIGAKNYWAAAAKWPWWMQWLIFTTATLVLYIPILGNTFVSDDWLVLKRLAMDGRLNTNGFFRPLSDMTIWLNYQLGGLNAFNYYLFGIILRGLSAVLLYQFCLRWPWAEGDARKYIFAGLSVLIFLSYPFHNESVAWILGRGALMAGILAMASLVILTGRYKHAWKITGICLCYFAGLLAYESILILPMLVLVYMVATNKSYSMTVLYVCFLALTLALHIFMRIEISGALSGDYGKKFINTDVWKFFFSGLKAVVRSFVPPHTDSNLLIAMAVFLLLFWFILIRQLQQVLRSDNRSRVLFFCIVGCWLFSLVLAGIGGVSTRTSESDRFLELPSYFLCMIVAFFMTFLLRRKNALLFTLLIIVTYNIFHLEKNNFNWAKASDVVKETLQKAQRAGGDGKYYFYNMPDELNGAYIFRVGFEDALLLNGVDTGRVQLLPLQFDLRSSTATIYYWDSHHWIEVER
jgi:hypothetical protein